MIKRILTLTIFLLILLTTNICQTQEEYSGYIVRFKDSGTSFLAEGMTLSDADPNFEDVIPEWNMYTTDSLDNIYEYEQAGLIESVSPNLYVELYDNYVFTPEDERYDHQWSLPVINADKVWNMGVFGENVTVGLIDSGLAWHYDISENVKAGYNYVTGATDVNDYTDTCNHGTSTAAIIASVAGTADYIGIAPKADIVALKAFADLKNGLISDIVRAIKDAVDVYNCDIINMSFGMYTDDSNIKEAIDYASSKGAILIAAAGNDNTTLTAYPGGYDNVINVGSVGMSKAEREAEPEVTHEEAYRRKSSFSNYGTSITVVAPGNYIAVNTLNNTNGSKYIYYQKGTSFSAPVVSAIAALCKSVKPELTHQEFEQLLIETCDDIGEEGKDIYFGYGLVDAGAAVEKLVKEKELYISPMVMINRKAFSVINNNTDTEHTYLDFMEKNGSLTMAELISPAQSRTYSGIKLTATEDFNPYTIKHFIWGQNLRPIHKDELIKATNP